MKSLSAKQINQACQRYINLKSDKEYKSYYKVFTALKLLAENPRFEAENVCVSLQSYILTKWDLKHVISPFLKIRLDDNFDTTSKSVQLILGGFGLVEETPFIHAFFSTKAHHKGHNTSATKEQEEKQMFKYMIYLFRVNLKMSTRKISRLFTIDKSTVDIWVEEIEKLDVSVRNRMKNDLLFVKKFENRDAYGNPYKLTRLNDNIEQSDIEADELN